MNGSPLYIRNRSCRCPRCMAGHATGPLIMVTIGVLFLLENFTRFGFDNTWPLLLIVIGGIGIAKRSASTEGHIQPGWAGMPPQQSGVSQPPYPVTPPPPTSDPTSGDPSSGYPSSSSSGSSEVNRG